MLLVSGHTCGCPYGCWQHINQNQMFRPAVIPIQPTHWLYFTRGSSSPGRRFEPGTPPKATWFPRNSLVLLTQGLPYIFFLLNLTLKTPHPLPSLPQVALVSFPDHLHQRSDLFPFLAVPLFRRSLSSCVFVSQFGVAHLSVSQLLQRTGSGSFCTGSFISASPGLLIFPGSSCRTFLPCPFSAFSAHFFRLPTVQAAPSFSGKCFYTLLARVVFCSLSWHKKSSHTLFLSFPHCLPVYVSAISPLLL